MWGGKVRLFVYCQYTLHLSRGRDFWTRNHLHAPQLLFTSPHWKKARRSGSDTAAHLSICCIHFWLSSSAQLLLKNIIAIECHLWNARSNKSVSDILSPGICSRRIFLGVFKWIFNGCGMRIGSDRNILRLACSSTPCSIQISSMHLEESNLSKVLSRYRFCGVARFSIPGNYY